MALPGGRRQPGDQDLLQTVLRETQEEVGVSLSRESFAGALEDVVPRTPVLPPIAVRPFVFLPRDRPTVVLNSEVALARWVRLDDLLSPGAHRLIHLDVAGESREVAAYHVSEGLVWGMTERILTSLVQHLRS